MTTTPKNPNTCDYKPMDDSERDKKMSRQLNPLQQAILTKLASIGSLSENQMVILLTPKQRLSAQDRLLWDSEIRLQAELLSMYGLIRMVERSLTGQRIYVATPGILNLAPPKPRTKPSNPRKPARPSRVPMSRPLAAMVAVVMASSGCGMTPSFLLQDHQAAPIPRYNPEGILAPERIEQFANSGNRVYRFCNGAECPQPTPKRPAARPMPITTSIDEAPTAAEPLPVMVTSKVRVDPEAPQKPKRAEIKEKTAKATVESGPKTEKPGQAFEKVTALAGSPETVPVRTSPPAPLKMASAIVAVPPVVRAQPAVEMPAAVSLKPDRNFDSYVGFAAGSETLGPGAKRAISAIVAAARQADTVRLKGHAGRRILDDSTRKLAVGRSVAVRQVLVKEGVERSRIKILAPTDNNLINSANPGAPENLCVEIQLLSATHLPPP
ncbi:MAG: OmpA family protein [Sulfuricella sp.]|nr:OmpA family protein [Sulfuricella sp.]